MRRRSTLPETDDEAVSVTVGYILNIGIATIAISFLVFQLQGAFGEVTDRAAKTQLQIVGENIVVRMTEADRLAAQNGSGTMVIETPDSISDRGYGVSVSDEWVNLSQGTTTVNVHYNVTHDVVGTSYEGGSRRTIEFNETHLVVR